MSVRPVLLAIFSAIVLIPADAQAANPVGTPDPKQPALLENVVRDALGQELSGNNGERNSLLQEVADRDPEFAPARWHLGYLKVNDAEWVPYRRFVDDQDERWHQLYLYRQNREERGDTVQDHLYLADGARKRGMRDEERAHLMRVIELEWDHTEARRRLGHVRLPDATWMTREDSEAARQYSEFVARSLSEWLPATTRIVELLRHENARARQRGMEQLAALRDPRVIPAVEVALLTNGLEREYLDWLSECSSWEASVAMAGLAVRSESAALRVAAHSLLRERRVDDYAPLLLDLLYADPSVDWRLMETRKRWLVLVQTVSYGDAEANYQYVNRIWYRPEFLIYQTREGARYYIGDDIASIANDPSRRRQALQHAIDRNRGFYYDIARRVIEAEQINDRVCRCLAATTGADGLEGPADWWAWWNERNVVYTAGEKPLYQVQYEEKWAVDRYDRIVEAQDVLRQASCFAAGTPVVTEYGAKPIDEIVLGDRVLAQDVDTGRIAFKPVFKTTVRPPAELLTITTEHGELTCTAGHPFWINGLGWRLAFELEPGMRFHSVDGSCEITSIEDANRTEQAYNLVVADYHNYFVGEGRILSHDNSPRSPTNALVPGLMPDWSTGVPADN